MAGAPDTLALTRTEWIANIDAALEVALVTALKATLPYTASGSVTAGVRKVSRGQAVNMLAKRALYKATQRTMRQGVVGGVFFTPGSALPDYKSSDKVGP